MVPLLYDAFYYILSRYIRSLVLLISRFFFKYPHCVSALWLESSINQIPRFGETRHARNYICVFDFINNIVWQTAASPTWPLPRLRYASPGGPGIWSPNVCVFESFVPIIYAYQWCQIKPEHRIHFYTWKKLKAKRRREQMFEFRTRTRVQWFKNSTYDAATIVLLLLKIWDSPKKSDLVRTPWFSLNESR